MPVWIQFGGSVTPVVSAVSLTRAGLAVSNARFFTGPRPDDRRVHQNTALVGLVWWFGNKQGAW